MNEDFWRFVDEHKDDDPTALRLRFGKRDFPFDLDLALTQIECRKHRKKLPLLEDYPRFLFPLPISGEQATAQRIASWHATLFDSSMEVADLTAGLGIDAMSIAPSSKSVTAIELNPKIAAALRYNAAMMGVDNLEVINADSEEWIRKCGRDFDTIFIDPARRGAAGKRTYAFEDCQPDVTGLMPLLLEKSPRVIIKASPMLDVKEIIRQLPQTASIHAVALKGEMKELLVTVQRDLPPCRRFIAIDFEDDAAYEFEVGESASDWKWNGDLPYVAGDIPHYLYEPNGALMKLAPWNALLAKYPDLLKCDPNTHLFLSDTLYPDFPGRIFEITGQLKRGMPAVGNVMTRNYPLSAEQLKKKLKVKSTPDNLFIIGLRIGGKPAVFTATRFCRV